MTQILAFNCSLMSDFKYVLYNTCRLENSVLIVLALIMPKKDNKLAKNVGAARCL